MKFGKKRRRAKEERIRNNILEDCSGATLPAKVLVGLIIALIGVVLLILLIVGISNLVTSSHMKEQAEGQLKMIQKALYNAVEEEVSDFLLYAPAGSYLIGMQKVDPAKSVVDFNIDSLNYKITPGQTCYQSDCLCICEKSGKSFNCEKDGVCTAIDFPPWMMDGNRKALFIEIGGKILMKWIQVEFRENEFLFQNAELTNYDNLFEKQAEGDVFLTNTEEQRNALAKNYFSLLKKRDWKKDIVELNLNSEDEAYFHYRLKEKYLDVYPSTFMTIPTSDDKKYVFSHIVFRASEKYKISPLVILALLNAESGLLSGEEWDPSKNPLIIKKAMGDLSDVKGDELCNNKDNLLKEIDSLNIDYKSSIKTEEVYIELLNQIVCGTKKISEIYKKDLELPSTVIGNQKVNVQNKETAAIYYYLYYDKKTDKLTGDIKKADFFWFTYSRLKNVFHLKIPEVNDAGPEGWYGQQAIKIGEYKKIFP